MINSKVINQCLNKELLEEIVEEYKKSLEPGNDLELIQLSLFVGFIEIEDWLEHYYKNIEKSGNCYKLIVNQVKIIILRVASYKEDYTLVFPFYKKKP